MGWKTFKEKFQIKCNISIQGNKIILGTSHIPAYASVDMSTGEFEEIWEDGYCSENFKKLMKASPKTILKAINAKDTFEKDIKIYLMSEWGLIFKLCEDPSVGKTTHCGSIITNGVHSTNKDTIIQNYINTVEDGISNAKEFIRQREIDLEKVRQSVKRASKDLVAFKEEHGKTDQLLIPFEN